MGILRAAGFLLPHGDGLLLDPDHVLAAVAVELPRGDDEALQPRALAPLEADRTEIRNRA
jgi:hypothetical protein